MKYIFRGIGYVIGVVLFALGLLNLSTVQAEEKVQAKEKRQTEIPKLSSTADLPRPFGYKSTWLAVRTEDTKAVFDAIGLTQGVISNWKSGIKFSYNRDFDKNVVPTFVTPPVNGWTLVLTGLGLGADGEAPKSELETLLKHLSKRFGESQYFGSYRVVDYVSWYRAKNGKIERGFSFADGTLFANIGQTTKAELDAGYFDMTDMTEQMLWDVFMKAEEESQTYYINEEDPMKIAETWSVNPLSIDKVQGLIAATGLAGLLIK
jgi:hypothetical protein